MAAAAHVDIIDRIIRGTWALQALPMPDSGQRAAIATAGTFLIEQIHSPGGNAAANCASRLFAGGASDCPRPSVRRAARWVAMTMTCNQGRP